MTLNSDHSVFPPLNDMDVVAALDAFWPAWDEMRDGQTVRIGSRVVERGPTGWAVWQPSTRVHNEPREIGGYSRDTAWALSDRGLLRELEAESGNGTRSLVASDEEHLILKRSVPSDDSPVPSDRRATSREHDHG